MVKMGLVLVNSKLRLRRLQFAKQGYKDSSDSIKHCEKVFYHSNRSAPNVMDPLEFSALHTVEDWNAFKPDMKGYTAPKDLDLWPECDTIEDQLRKFTLAEFLGIGHAPIIAVSSSKWFSNTQIIVYGETFSLPLSPRESAFLSAHLGHCHDPRLPLPESEVKLTNEEARRDVWQISSKARDEIQALDGDRRNEEVLRGLNVYKSGSHQLESVAKSLFHYATVFVIFPAFTNGVDVHFRASHKSAISKVQLPKDLGETMSAVTVYTGVTDLYIEVSGGEVLCLTYHVSAPAHTNPLLIPALSNISGSSAPLRDAFCLWKYSLLHGRDTSPLMVFFLHGSPTHARDFERRSDDATLLCHFAPLAKAYGFKLYIAECIYTQSTEHEIYHRDDEYIECCDDRRFRRMRMSDKPEEDYEFVGLTTLGGDPVANEGLLTLASKLIQRDVYLQDQIQFLNYDKEYDIVDQVRYISTVKYKHVYSATVLFVAP
ncbi:hypothetical protein R3P38DRAFT_2987152 [Favolaschia claudopus]|uniref:Uncharacterized protein n=1 Tax=Favolaschia claudopus TaxID=2862362 RepID=A0AAW0AVY7_9AGAR